MRTAVDKLCFTILLGAAAAAVHAEDWPHWRGPRGIGVSGETNLPERWSATEQVAWKAPVAGAGISTPVVAGGRVYVTSQIGEGVSRRCAIGPDTCLYRALARYALLRESGYAPRFVMGVDEDDVASGHAWLELDGAPFLEPGSPRFCRTFEHPPRA